MTAKDYDDDLFIFWGIESTWDDIVGQIEGDFSPFNPCIDLELPIPECIMFDKDGIPMIWTEELILE